jgi:hypothetical protein
MTSPLENLCADNGPLRKEAVDPTEFAGLQHSGTVRLADAKNESNSLESRFDLAYNAAHAFCLAALRRLGYRAANRYIVFQVLPHTLGLGPEVWRILDKAHKLRNQSEYEGDLAIDDRVVADLISACDRVAATLLQLARG